jgi:hypothetical protein
MSHPLEDPTYTPAHPPMAGEVPDVVAKWGAASQIRWFRRFHDELKPQRYDYWSRFHTGSPHHRGDCCISCEQDSEVFEDVCCCRGLKYPA